MVTVPGMFGSNVFDDRQMKGFRRKFTIQSEKLLKKESN